MKHRYKGIDGAVRSLRRMEKSWNCALRLLEKYAIDRRQLAKLAAKGPAFFNLLEAMAAEKLRDEILLQMGMNPDGSPTLAPSPKGTD